MSKSMIKVEEKIKSFEQAFVPDKESFVVPKLNSILLALDAHTWAVESSRYSIEVALELSQIQEAFVQVVCMAVNEEEFDESEKLVSEAVQQLQTKQVKCSGICIIGSPSKNILRLIDDESHDLVILPSPYAERVEEDNLDSLGATIEILLNNSQVPVLLISKPEEIPSSISTRILLPILEKKDIATVEWGILLSHEDTFLNILNMVRSNVVEEVREVSKELLDEDLNEELIEVSLRKNTVSIISALREIGEEKGLEQSISNRLGNPIDSIEEQSSANQPTIIIANYVLAIEDGSRLVKYTKKQKIPLFIIK
jgi:nucleotide-binding universal stress UspA family protein